MQIWKGDEKIFMYFDLDQMIIYPENRSGFDKIFARIHINNTNKQIEVSYFHFFVKLGQNTWKIMKNLLFIYHFLWWLSEIRTYFQV